MNSGRKVNERSMIALNGLGRSTSDLRSDLPAGPLPATLNRN